MAVLEFAADDETLYDFKLKVSFYVAIHQIPYKQAPPADTELVIYRIYSKINCEDFKHQQ